MDAFFASVEQRDNPELRGKPTAVGGDSERGVVATASYEARPFGVHSAMSMRVAKRLCPQLIVVPGRYHIYKEVSRQMHAIFHEYTDLVEPISLDEAFLDVTENKPGIALAVDIAREIKAKIKERLHLTASAGVSYNKFLAKIASDQRKPDGLCTIHPSCAQDFIDKLRIEKFWLVGPKTAETMHKMGIYTGADLRQVSLKHLTDVFGKMGPVFYNFSRGIDNRPVVVEWERKSMGCERTFEHDINSAENRAINAMQEPQQAAPAPRQQQQPGGEPADGRVQLIINVLLLVVGATGLIVACVAKKDAANARSMARDELKALSTALQQHTEALESALRVMDQRLSQVEQGNAASLHRPPAASRAAAPHAASRQPRSAVAKVVYLTRPDESGRFMGASSRFERGNSIFQLSTTDGTTGSFIVIDDDEVNRLALMMPTENLTRACTGNNIQVSGGMRRIVTDAAGRAVLDNGRWRIVTPAKIHYEA